TCGRERTRTDGESAIRPRFVRDSFHSLRTFTLTPSQQRVGCFKVTQAASAATRSWQPQGDDSDVILLVTIGWRHHVYKLHKRAPHEWRMRAWARALQHRALQLQMRRGTPYQATVDGSDRCPTRLGSRSMNASMLHLPNSAGDKDRLQ